MRRVIDAAIGAAWAMEEGALATLLEIASREHQITPEALAGYKSTALEGAEKAGVRQGVAIIDVAGPLFKRANLMTAYCGASSYDVLMRDLTTALDDGNVRAILVNVDSPGGEVSGCAEFAQAIFDARGRKPIVAYVGDQASSAAYWIASACDEIVCGPTAMLGSIGVRATLPDSSARDAKTGVVRHDFVSSQSPYKTSDPKSEDGRARIQATVDTLAQVFVETVARNRGVSAGRVLDDFGKGDVKIGTDAVKAKMADRIGSFESTIADISNSADPLGLARAGAGPQRTSSAAKDESAAVDAMLATIGMLSARKPLGATGPGAKIVEGPAAPVTLAAFKTYTPANHERSLAPSADDEAAAAMILEMMPSHHQKAN